MKHFMGASFDGALIIGTKARRMAKPCDNSFELLWGDLWIPVSDFYVVTGFSSPMEEDLTP